MINTVEKYQILELIFQNNTGCLLPPWMGVKQSGIVFLKLMTLSKIKGCRVLK